MILITTYFGEQVYRDFFKFIGVEWKLHHSGDFFHLQTHQLACEFLTPTFYELIFSSHYFSVQQLRNVLAVAVLVLCIFFLQDLLSQTETIILTSILQGCISLSIAAPITPFQWIKRQLAWFQLAAYMGGCGGVCVNKDKHFCPLSMPSEKCKQLQKNPQQQIYFVWNMIKYFAASGFNRNWEVLVALHKAI